MSAPVAPPTLTTSFEPPGRSSPTPAGVPPDGPPFQATLETEWARTAVAEGQKEAQSQAGSDSAQSGSSSPDGRARHGATAGAIGVGTRAGAEAASPAEPLQPATTEAGSEGVAVTSAEQAAAALALSELAGLPSVTASANVAPSKWW